MGFNCINIIGKNYFPYHFQDIHVFVRYKKIGYNIDVLRQTAYLVVNPIKANSFFFLGCFIAVVSICSVCDFSIVTPTLQCQLSALLFVCVLFVLFLLFVVVLSGEPKQKQGRGMVDPKVCKPPIISLLAVQSRLFCFGSLAILDVACCYL